MGLPVTVAPPESPRFNSLCPSPLQGISSHWRSRKEGGRPPESGKVLQTRFTDILTEMAEGQTYPLSPRRPLTGRKVHGSCLHKGGKSPWRAPAGCWAARMTHDALPGVTQSSSKPWEVSSVTLWLQVRKRSPINLIYLFSPMPGVSYSKTVGFFFLSSYHIMNVSLV